MHIPIETVQTDTFEMRYFQFGHGEKTMVILPGLSVQSVMELAESVADEYEIMSRDFTVYVFDRRSALPAAYSVGEMARDTAAAFRALGLREICLFGASQGGMMALELAADAPGLIRRLAVGSASSHVKDAQYQTLREWIALAEKKDGVGLYLAFGEKLYPPALFAAYREMLVSAGETVTDAQLERFAVLAGGTEGFCITERLSEIQCPVLVIGSTDDAVVGSEAAAEIAGQLRHRPDSELYMYTGYGHAAYDTAPDYRQRIYDFFIR